VKDYHSYEILVQSNVQSVKMLTYFLIGSCMKLCFRSVPISAFKLTLKVQRYKNGQFTYGWTHMTNGTKVLTKAQVALCVE
jgi:hypothetical protein